MAFGKRRRQREDAEGAAEAADTGSTAEATDTAEAADGAAGEQGGHAEGGEALDHGQGRADHADQTAGRPSDVGPWDVTEVDEDDDLNRIDVGAMRLPVPAGLNLRVDVTAQGGVAGVRLVGEGSEIQLGAFAAPRTAGIWDEVREGIRESLTAQGGKVTDGEGSWGPELTAMMPTPNGLVPGRFIGVDGPRWFLRALIIGKAALDRSAAQPYEQVLREMVVVRGDEAMPVKEPVPIVLPEEIRVQMEAQIQAQAQAQAQAQNQTQNRPGTPQSG